MNLDGKVCLVTGAASGVGREMCRQFADAGSRVIAADVNGQGAEETISLCGDGPHAARQLDVSDENSWLAIRQFVQAEFGRCNVLCNNAGVFRVGNLDEAPIEDWYLQQKVNCDGVVLGCRSFYRDFVASGGGHIVNTASLSGLFGAPGLSTYTATKFAVVGLTHSLRNELMEHGVSVSCLVPGAIDTPMNHDIDVPLEDRLIPPADVARAVVTAVSSGANPHYIFTHDEFYDLLDEYFGGILGEYRAFREAAAS